jgi:hypothetical protein
MPHVFVDLRDLAIEHVLVDLRGATDCSRNESQQQ